MIRDATGQAAGPYRSGAEVLRVNQPGENPRPADGFPSVGPAINRELFSWITMASSEGVVVQDAATMNSIATTERDVTD